MKVDSDGQVADLNADELVRAKTYRVNRPITVDEVFSTAVLCDTRTLPQRRLDG